ncbi:MAG TPA: Ig-like domain-containing protein [Verrucomicrobiae bacterium]|nr:Ig-like domain-containing protein [Verrucomicrobiae bacterium]
MRRQRQCLSTGKWLAILASLGSGGLLWADPPNAVNDMAVTLQNQAVTIPMLTNDFNSEGNQLAILQVSAPAHGTLVINSNAPVTTPELLRLFQFSGTQLSNTVHLMLNTNTYPRSTQTNGNWNTVNNADWTCGFFPGCLWYLYEQTDDPNFKKWAQQWTAGIAAQQFNTNTDDVGFMINTSFGNGYRITGSSSYQSVLLQTAHSFTNRWNYIVRSLADDQLLPPTNFEVIIDTMMNTELLYHATDINGDTNLSSKACTHATRAMTNQIRADNSTFQRVLYSTVDGSLTFQGTRAGYSNTSTWARGQAWAIYGFTMAYRETGYAPFLDAAKRTATYFLTNIPPDYVPYWDFDAPDIPNAPRDSSAAAITLSALVQLSQLVTNMQDSATLWAGAHNILESLGSTNYLAQGTTSKGILRHGTGEPPQFSSPEVDVSLTYGDYYFVEALRRYALAYGRTNVTYTPYPGFTGTDTFTCQVCDSGGNCSTGTVTVLVVGTNAVSPFNAQFSLAPATRQPLISFATVSNHVYEVDYANSLTPPIQWSLLPPYLSGSNFVISVSDTNPAPLRFYRIKAW